MSALKETLESPRHSFKLAVISLDDFYLTHSDQIALAKSQPTNPLVQHRGQPSTHDLDLLVKTLKALQAKEPTSLPVYDKSQFSGAGDRAPQETWPRVESADVIILEGWCVAFTALSYEHLTQQHSTAVALEDAGKGTGSLGKLKFEDILFVNDALRAYGAVWEKFDAVVHVDAAQTEWVYDWRLEAEVKMRQLRGVENAMSDEKVREFVDGCEDLSALFVVEDEADMSRLPSIRAVHREVAEGDLRG